MSFRDGQRPGIFNTDQGSQFTSEEFTGTLSKADVRISMDGRGRCFDNIFIEREFRNEHRSILDTDRACSTQKWYYLWILSTDY